MNIGKGWREVVVWVSGCGKGRRDDGGKKMSIKKKRRGECVCGGGADSIWENSRSCGVGGGGEQDVWLQCVGGGERRVWGCV